jgi:AcrR family transcriptional regulator
MAENTNAPQLRGPADHSVRDQIVEAATVHFKHYGYEKTTVSDLAKAIGFSKAYIYKFFESKQAIGEVICSNRLLMVSEAVESAIAGSTTASEKLRRLFRALAEAGTELFFQDRKLYDIATAAATERWPSVSAHQAWLRGAIEQIVKEGRSSGEFERKTPLDETVGAICLVMHPYCNPLLLQHNLDSIQEATTLLSALILRSLAP